MATSKGEPPWGALALVAASAFLAHARALGAGFCFDDRGAIEENTVVQGELDLGALFGTDFWGKPPGEGPGTWRPLVVFSFWVNRHVAGTGFHGTNLLLHAATSVVLALALARHTGRATFAILAAMVFGVLGVHTEAVVSLVGRADVMAAGLAWLAWFVAGRAEEVASPRKALWAALAFAGALASKESAIVFPLFLLLADRLLSPPGRAPRLLSARYGSLVAAAFGVIALRTVAFASPLSVMREFQANPLLAEGLGPRIWTSLRLFGMALGRIVWPVGLSADYSYAAILPDRSPLVIPVLVGALALVGLVVLAIRLRRREPLLSLAAVMVLVPWIVASHVPFVLPTIFAERLLYLPAAGFALAIARLGEWVLQRRSGALAPVAPRVKPGKKRATEKRKASAGTADEGSTLSLDPARVRACALVLGPVMLGNVALAWKRAPDWKNERTLFEAAIAVVPRSARAHHNYGSALLNDGKAAGAIAPLERACEILPSWAEPHAQLGVAMLEVGRPLDAEEHFRKAVELDPTSPKAVFNLAVFFAREGRLEDARATLAPFVERYPKRTREATLLRQIEAELRTPRRP